MALELTAQQKQKAIDWINRRAPALACPSCKQQNFAIADHLVSANVFTPDGGLMLGGATYPQFLVTCTNCGHVLHYSAVMAGLTMSVPSIPKPPPAPTNYLGSGPGVGSVLGNPTLGSPPSVFPQFPPRRK